MGLFSELPVNSGESSGRRGDVRLTLRTEHGLENKPPTHGQQLCGDDEAILLQ